MSGSSPANSVLRIADLAPDRPFEAILTPDAPERAAIAARLGVTALKKLRFAARLSPLGKKDWQLTADLGATVMQDCVVTLAPVTTRIDERVQRSYLTNPPELAPDEEAQMPEDDTVEGLPELLDLGAVMEEALSLALPAFPRADGADLAETAFAPAGAAPSTEDNVKPFAALAELKKSLGEDGAD